MRTSLHIIVFKIHLYIEIYIACLCHHFHASVLATFKQCKRRQASHGKYPTKRRRGYPLSASEEICGVEIFWIPEKRRLKGIYICIHAICTLFQYELKTRPIWPGTKRRITMPHANVSSSVTVWPARQL